MTLRASRIDFIDFSGRYDLVVNMATYADNGADRYIRAGQRWLDRTFEISAKNARRYVSVVAGTWYALIPSNRVLHEVWMSLNSEGDKWKLRKLDLTQWRNEASGDPALVANGMPVFWTHASLRVVPEVANSTTIDQYGTTAYTAVGNHWDSNGIIWTPPVDRTTTLEVHGNFYHPELQNDTDTNYWTEEESHVLVMAACRAVEQSYRNFQGVRDWEQSIKGEVVGLEFDLADQESTGVTAIDGTGL